MLHAMAHMRSAAANNAAGRAWAAPVKRPPCRPARPLMLAPGAQRITLAAPRRGRSARPPPLSAVPAGAPCRLPTSRALRPSACLQRRTAATACGGPRLRKPSERGCQGSRQWHRRRASCAADPPRPACPAASCRFEAAVEQSGGIMHAMPRAILDALGIVGVTYAQARPRPHTLPAAMHPEPRRLLPWYLAAAPHPSLHARPR